MGSSRSFDRRWLGARCVRVFCGDRSLEDRRIEAFCRHIEQGSFAENIPEWDSSADGLEITGLGDPLPPDLSSVEQLAELLDAVREISASQMYTAWAPDSVASYLREALRISRLDLQKAVNLDAMSRHDGRAGAVR